MRIEPAAQTKSIATLTTLDVNEGFPEALQRVVDAAKLLFGADGGAGRADRGQAPTRVSGCPCWPAGRRHRGQVQRGHQPADQ